MGGTQGGRREDDQHGSARCGRLAGAAHGTADLSEKQPAELRLSGGSRNRGRNGRKHLPDLSSGPLHEGQRRLFLPQPDPRRALPLLGCGRFAVADFGLGSPEREGDRQGVFLPLDAHARAQIV